MSDRRSSTEDPRKRRATRNERGPRPGDPRVRRNCCALAASPRTRSCVGLYVEKWRVTGTRASVCAARRSDSWRENRSVARPYRRPAREKELEPRGLSRISGSELRSHAHRCAPPARALEASASSHGRLGFVFFARHRSSYDFHLRCPSLGNPISVAFSLVILKTTDVS